MPVATMMWDDLLTARRHPDEPVDEGRAGRPFYERNYDRILFSASFRRLANKTQVHPLYQNDNLHHRLIHSVEVGSVAQTLGHDVGERLVAIGRLTPGQVARMAGITRAAALAHDIGNPPFGHAGEEAIGKWFARRFEDATSPFWAAITPAQRTEFTAFEGNAQGFRILTRNEIYHPDLYEGGAGMALSAAVLGAFTKYPARAATSATARARAKASNGPLYCGLKKYGLFESSWRYFEQIAQTLGLIPRGDHYCRHPLVFLVEAADDICYNIMDLEDAHTAGDLPFERVCGLLEQVADRSRASLPRLAAHPARMVETLRAAAIRCAVVACVDAFLAHYDAIMAGDFSGDLIGGSRHAAAFAEMKRVAKTEVFTAARKIELEIYGRNLIHEVLDQLSACVIDFAGAGYDPARFADDHAYSARLLGVVNFDLLGVRDPYSALQAVTDFVSGMTDRYAVHFVQMTKGGL